MSRAVRSNRSPLSKTASTSAYRDRPSTAGLRRHIYRRTGFGRTRYKQDRILAATAWLVMARFLIIVIVNAITHSLPHDLVECATMWLIIGTPVLILSTHAVLH